MIMNRPANRILLLLAGVALVVGLYPSCRQLDTPFVADDENIMLYISQSEDGRELFRTAGLYSDSPYTLAGDTAIYRLIVDSVQRKTELVVTPLSGPFKDYNLGTGPTLRDAELAVDDFFYGRLLRIAGIDTTTTIRRWGLFRQGFFLKLGADDHPYLGWKLWAFNGGLDQSPPAPLLMFMRSNGTGFSYQWSSKDTLRTYHILNDGDSLRDTLGRPRRFETEFKYVRLDKSPLLAKGERLGASVSIPDFSVEIIANARMSTGYDAQSLRRPNFEYYIDSIRTSPTNTNFWNLLTFVERRVRVEQGITITTYINWCIPYRVAQ
jgi:hypothetical protein